MNDEQPTMTCPKCKAELPDFDGFGVLAHTKPAYPDGCGYCSHPSRDGDAAGNMVCGICGDVEKKCEHKWEHDGPPRLGGRNQPIKCSACGARGGIIKPSPTPRCSIIGCSGPGMWLGPGDKPICDKHRHILSGGGTA